MTDLAIIPTAQTVPESDKVMAIIELIESGQSERSACDQVGMNRMTFRSRALKLGAANHYARATTALAQFQVEEFEKIIEELKTGTIDHQSARVIMDGRKWIASKLFPRQWGDKVAVTGGDPEQGDRPIQLDVSGLSAETLAELAGVKVVGE